jgi:hypothetical protein
MCTMKVCIKLTTLIENATRSAATFRGSPRVDGATGVTKVLLAMLHYRSHFNDMGGAIEIPTDQLANPVAAR